MSFDLASRLAARRAAHLYRQRPLLQTPQGPDVVVDGDRLLAFSSNDYLGLAGEIIRRNNERNKAGKAVEIV